MGFDVDWATGLITEVACASAADLLGVKVGWYVEEIEGVPCFKNGLEKYVNGLDPFQVSFKNIRLTRNTGESTKMTSNLGERIFLD